MTRLLTKWRALSTRTRVLLVAALALAIGGAGAAAYALLKRDSDVSCPAPCELEADAKPPKRVERETVNWPVYGYDDQRTRYLPTKQVRPPYRASEWSFNAGKLLEFSPIVVDGSLYFQDKDSLFYSLDAENGKVEWKNEIGDLAASSPAYSDGRLFAVTLEPGDAVALRARDGKQLWRRPLPGRSETSPVVFGRSVIVGSESGDVFALDAEDGDVKWQVSTAGNVKGGLALDEGILYGANYAGEVFAIRASSGEFVWRSSTQGLSLRAWRARLLDAGRRLRPRLPRQHRRPRLQLRRRQRRARSGATRPATGSTPALPSPTPSAPSRPYTSARRIRTSTPSTRRPARCAGRRTSAAIVLGAASVLGEVVYVGVHRPEHRHLRLRRQDRQAGLRIRARRVQPGDLGRRAPLPHRSLGHPRLRARDQGRAQAKGRARAPPAGGAQGAPAGGAGGAWGRTTAQ